MLRRTSTSFFFLRSSSPLLSNNSKNSAEETQKMWDFVCQVCGPSSSSTEKTNNTTTSNTDLMSIGDDVYGEDTIVNTLQSRVAQEYFGKSHALFFPTHKSALLATIGSYDGLYGDGHQPNSSSSSFLFVPSSYFNQQQQEQLDFEALGDIVSFISGKRLAMYHPENSDDNNENKNDNLTTTRKNSLCGSGGSNIVCISRDSTVSSDVLKMVTETNKKKSNVKLHLDIVSGDDDGDFDAINFSSMMKNKNVIDSFTLPLNSLHPGCEGALVISSDECFIQTHVARMRKQLGMGTRQVGIMAASSYYQLFVKKGK